jgi:predicted  nucleic acid-binding Zn-ribbon protein
MKYIQNTHNAPITANARNEKGQVMFSKTFLPARTDRYTGRIEATGYTQLTDEEYRRLNETSKVFTVYRDKHKLLVEHNELPPEAKTPHEALVDARKEARKLAAEIVALKAEIVTLKASLLNAETDYKELFNASSAGADLLAKEAETVRRNLQETLVARDELIAKLKEENRKLTDSLAGKKNNKDTE